jgi:hypothetical protein
MSAIWGKLYGTLHSSLKWQRSTKGARALWTTAASWSIAQGTDGFVPSDVRRSLDGSTADVSKLVEVGLWEVVEGGWQFHDWLGHNHSDQQIQDSRQATRERVQRHRTKQGNGVSNGVTSEGGNALRVTPRNGVSNTARTEQTREEQTDSRAQPEFQNTNALLASYELTESDRREFLAWMKNKPGVRNATSVINALHHKGTLSGELEDWRLDRDASKVRPMKNGRKVPDVGLQEWKLRG